MLKIKTYTRNKSLKRRLLNGSLALSLLLGSCTAIKDAANRAQLKKNNEPTQSAHSNASTFEQVSPIKGKVISPFGYRGRHHHAGSDIKLQRGDTVRAAFCGRITKAAPYSGYGNLVIIKHVNNLETYYGHLSKCLVQAGDSVSAGDVIGLGGRTGRATTDHLHFEVRYKKVPQNAENFFDFSSGTVRINFLAYSPTSKNSTRTTIASTSPEKTIKEEPAKENLSEALVTIKKGDTLYSLAKQNGITIKQLQELNNLKSSFLQVGMKVKVR